MKLLWLGGNHPRHLYYINAITQKFPVVGGVMEIRGGLLPAKTQGVCAHDQELFNEHFARRERTEAKYFGPQKPPACPLRMIDRPELNTDETAEFVRGIQADAAVVFGCGLIRSPLLEALPQHTLNLHLGLSPRYRGSATLFWPFYFMEPAFAGSTIHYLLAEPDAGAIVHQSVPRLQPEDGIHDVACKVVQQSAADMRCVLGHLERHGDLPTFLQKTSGKLFLNSDFRPEHLRVNYDIFQDRMTREYLEGRLTAKKPKLVRLFEQ